MKIAKVSLVCGGCGQALREDARFCGRCGSSSVLPAGGTAGASMAAPGFDYAVTGTPHVATPAYAGVGPASAGAYATGSVGVVDGNLKSLDPLISADETIEFRCDLHYGSFALTQRRVVAIAHPDNYLASLLWRNAEWVASMHDRRAVTFFAYRKFFHPGRLMFGILLGLAALFVVGLGFVTLAGGFATGLIAVVLGLLIGAVSFVFLRYSRMGRVLVTSDGGASSVRVRTNERDQAVQFVAAAAATLGTR